MLAWGWAAFGSLWYWPLGPVLPCPLKPLTHFPHEADSQYLSLSLLSCGSSAERQVQLGQEGPGFCVQSPWETPRQTSLVLQCPSLGPATILPPGRLALGQG